MTWHKRKHHSPSPGYEEEWCPDCQTRNALNPATGKPVMRHGLLLTGGCESCGGSGRVVVQLGKYPRYTPRVGVPGLTRG